MSKALDIVIDLCSMEHAAGLHVDDAALEAVAQEASLHSVGPWILQRLHQEQYEEPWATRLGELLRTNRIAVLQTNIVRRSTLLQMSEALQKSLPEAPPLVALKGVALMMHTYESMDMRPTGDIDVLMPMPHTLAAYEVLKQQGAKSNYFSVRHASIFTSVAVHMPPVQQNGCSVELHYSLFGKGSEYNPAEDLSGHIVTHDLGGVKYGVLDTPMQLAHLALHIIKNRHNTSLRVGWMVDVALMLSQNAAQLPQLLTTVEGYAPRFRPELREVWLRAASMSTAEARQATQEHCGAPAQRLTEDYLRGASRLRRAVMKMKRMRNIVWQGVRYVMGCEGDAGANAWQRAADVVAYHTKYAAHKLENDRKKK